MRKKMYLLAGGPGGGDSTAGALRAALRESGCEHPAVAYIGTANGDSRSFMKWFEAPLRRAGAASLTMAPLVGKKADRAAAERLLRESSVIFLSGGEVEDGMNGLDAGIRALLAQRREEGALFLGLSAGSIMLGHAWPHWDDEDRRPDDAVLFGCLGFADAIFDTHAEAEGWPELQKAVALAGDGFVGYGIPSGEMAVIDENGVLIPNERLVRCENRGGRAVLCG
jgi:cyanophycinase-like exopeptidase